ncbi:MAG TPA: homoserine O-acetyltransferase [Solirubrobacterales bacterium]|nr:homoserine O-acetyltransferase [Solirubrobacterales bacterium]HMU27508.1 homoserine O-acetyltransferase [Solirubrobacterales bacterium]HMX71346.1 homoserine O-acetyltransferase [Solirubrobacterales bacterium]HMY26827.1 homoserine O-acetyltransferase [Solirubrobacterales bacterium]HNA24978.1 homoserine O-acetyltransferase [Solirubrobacterales bacterium]
MPDASSGIGIVETQRAVVFSGDRPLTLASGAILPEVEVAYETYGELNPDRSNAVFICHALSGDAHAAGLHEGDDPSRPGWWDNIVGPGRPLDTDRFFVISANVLGGCKGTTGPSSIDPATGKPYGLRFPLVQVRDLVEVHRALLRELGIDHLLAAIGGSLGGMQALQWAIDHPDEVDGAAIIAASARLSAQNIAFSAVAREAIMRDPDFAGGDYYERERRPDPGLALARMIGHITYLSEESMREKFGRRIQDAEVPRYGFDVDFQVESYLHYQGQSFVERFDANTYLYMGRTMDYFDPFEDPVLVQNQISQGETSFLVISFDSDWRFSTEHARVLASGLRGAGAPVTFQEISSPHGHDSFLFADPPEYHRTVAGYLDRLASQRGIPVPGATSGSREG